MRYINATSLQSKSSASRILMSQPYSNSSESYCDKNSNKKQLILLFKYVHNRRSESKTTFSNKFFFSQSASNSSESYYMIKILIKNAADFAPTLPLL